MANTKDLLKQHLAELQAQKAAIEEQTAPLRAKRDAKLLQEEAVRLEVMALTDQINEIERPDIITLSEEISATAKALGGLTMSEGITE